MKELLFAMCLIAYSQLSQAPAAADLVLLNGQLWTGSQTRPQAEAAACRAGRIVAVGTTAEVRQWVGPGTRVVDLQGRRVVPGFNDAHVHFFTGGQHLASVQLRDARTPEMFRDRIRDFAAKLPPGRWVSGGDWDHENWNPPRLPTRHVHDPVHAH